MTLKDQQVNERPSNTIMTSHTPTKPLIGHSYTFIDPQRPSGTLIDHQRPSDTTMRDHGRPWEKNEDNRQFLKMRSPILYLYLEIAPKIALLFWNPDKNNFCYAQCFTVKPSVKLFRISQKKLLFNGFWFFSQVVNINIFLLSGC